MCVTDRHDMTLAVKVALNPDTTNQPTCISFMIILSWYLYTISWVYFNQQNRRTLAQGLNLSREKNRTVVMTSFFWKETAV